MKKAKVKATNKTVPNKSKTAPKAPAPKPATRAKVKAPAPKPSAPAPEPAASEFASAGAIEALRQEVTALRSQLAKHLSPVTTGTIEEVDALRRVLNDLMEARMNEVIRELVTIRNTAAAAGSESQRVTEQMDTLLADLGAQKFEAERLEHVDPLIHTITREVSDARLPDGVVAETIRPGFHTGRGIVVAKALVAVNRRP